MDNIAVDPSCQSSGVGDLLLAAAETAARVADCGDIRLYTNEAMTSNVDYYRRRGFVEAHRAMTGGYRRVHLIRSIDQPS